MFGTLRASPGLFAWGTHAFCPPANVPARGGEWVHARLQTILSAVRERKQCQGIGPGRFTSPELGGRVLRVCWFSDN